VTLTRAAEAAEHQECLSARLLSLRSDFGRDLDRLSVSERRMLDSACSRIRDLRGREAYLECLSAQLLTLHNRRSPASPAPSEVAASLPPAVVGVPSAGPPVMPRQARSWLSAVWIGAAFLTVLVVAGGVLLAVKTRRPPRICRVCGGDAPESGDLCQKCRHEAAEAARHGATERADQLRSLQEEVRRQSEREEEQRRLKRREEEEAPLRQQEEARQREKDAQQREEEKSASLRTVVVPAPEEVFDPYAVLGVPRDASKDDIRAAHQEARLKYDPDHVTHLSEEVQAHYKERAQAVDQAYQKLTE
jgi:hypothetical protein